jgi:asparagine synthetase B (glutamine-hydrolysing)
VRHLYETLPRKRGLQFQWQFVGAAALLTGWDDPYGEPLIAQAGDWIAAGMVRLDNRMEVVRSLHCVDEPRSDLAVVLRAIAQNGNDCVSGLLGDFGFVAVNTSTRSGIAACDAFAVHKIFYAERGRFLAFSSRSEALATGDDYDLHYLLALVSLQNRARGATVYRGVQQLPPACIAMFKERHVQVSQYWSATSFEIEPFVRRSEGLIADECRQLLAESVRQRMARTGDTWAQLSGGLDSSSIVSLVQWLTERGELPQGLTGTVTFVDRHNTSTDERRYSESVVNRWQLRNEAIVDPPCWYDAGDMPPTTDQPRGDAHIYPRELRMCRIVQGAGGRVLLTGVGGDQLFMGNMLYLADWLVSGRSLSAIRHMANLAALGRVSFWHLAFRNAVLPLLPQLLHAKLVHDQHGDPSASWLLRRTLRTYGLSVRATTASAYGGRWGHKYHFAIASVISQLECSTHGSISGDQLDVRHPMLYRPLVEFALKLPPEQRARPHAHRWILRESMRGILPERVRTRVGKSGTVDFLTWSLGVNRKRLEFLLQRPVLADLGLLDAVKLREAFTAAADGSIGGRRMYGPLFETIAAEIWLQTRSGRWAHYEQPSNIESE